MYEYAIKRLLKVVDGDTIKVEIDLGFDLCVTATVRLAGIDTPESRTSDKIEKVFGLDAKHWLETMLNSAGIEKGTHVVRIQTAKDVDEKYGRLLGTLYISTETQSVNQLMVEHGYAWAYDGGTKKKNLQELLEIRTLRGTINGI